MMHKILALLAFLLAPSAGAQTNFAYPTIPYTAIQPTDFILLESPRFTTQIYTTLPIMAQWFRANVGLADFSCAGSTWLKSASGGVITCTQPAAANISGLAASATTDTTVASNITSGTLDPARLPAFTGGDCTSMSGSSALTCRSSSSINAMQATRTANGSIDVNKTTQRNVIAYIGDSWTYRDGITRPVREQLQAARGNAGVGYLNAYGADYPTYWPYGFTLASAGTWTQGTFGPDLASAKSSIVSSTKTYSGIFEKAVCIYKGVSGGGSFTWAVDGGPTTTINTSSTTGAQTFTISGLASGAVHTLAFNVTVAGSAGVEISGCDFRIEIEGVRVHRLGVPGSQVTGLLAALSTSDFNTMFGALGFNTAVVMFGTNDQNANVVPATYGANLQTLAAQLLTASPNSDIALASAADNGQVGKTYTMAQYAAAMQSAAASNGYAYIPVFESMGSYAKELATGAFDGVDPSHPSLYGEQTIANVELSYLNEWQSSSVVWQFSNKNLCVGQNAALPYFVGSGRAGPCGAVTTGYNLGLFGAGYGITTGHDITIAGYQSGNALTTQSNVTAFGPQNFQLSTTSNNTAVGTRNFQLSTTGTALYGVGVGGGSANVSGSNIAVFGFNPLVSSTDASTIMAFGNNAAQSSVHDGNIAIFGHNAFVSNNNGNGNYGGIGNSLFFDCASCYNNWGLGNSAGRGITTGKGNLILGPVTGLASGLSDAIVIGDGNGTAKADFNKTVASAWSFTGSVSSSGDVTSTSHLLASVAVPAASSCGTSPAVDAGSSNNGGKITFGSATTACTLTFANAFPNNAYCTISPLAQPAAVANIPYISAQSKTAFTISGGTASAAYQYNCAGN